MVTEYGLDRLRRNVKSPRQGRVCTYTTESIRQKAQSSPVQTKLIMHTLPRCIAAFVISLVVLSGLQFVPAQSAAGNGLATLQGMVSGFDEFGDRMPLSWVRLNATSKSFNLTAYTGLNGRYVMVLPPGAYIVTTFMQGYFSQSTNVTVAAGDVVLHDFMLRSVFSISPSPS